MLARHALHGLPAAEKETPERAAAAPESHRPGHACTNAANDVPLKNPNADPPTSFPTCAGWRYAGGKNGAGVFQTIINQMPPHRVYIEAFLGSGAIIRRKRPAALNIGLDVDASVIARHNAAAPDHARFQFMERDAIEFLEYRRKWRGDELVYCDPPYLGSARAWPSRRCYRHEMKGQSEHEALLRILTTLSTMVIVSGYASPLYDTALAGWRRVEFTAQTRGGPRTEVLWMNFPAPVTLHDYRFLGIDFHERCRIARKIARWQKRLAGLPTLERAAVISGLDLGNPKAADNAAPDVAHPPFDTPTP